MKVIIETLDLDRMWGRDKDMPSVTANTFPEDTFTVRLNRGEMLPLKYRITVPLLLKLESLNGSSDVVIVSKQEKGGKKEGTENEYYYNEVITAVHTLNEYMSVAKKACGFQSRFAKPMPPKDKPAPTRTAGPQQHEQHEDEEVTYLLDEEPT